MKTLFTLVLAAILSGCAAMTSLTSDVSTYSRWPAERKPSTFVFERLPSQQDRAEQQQMLEDAARPALQSAGFTEAVDPKGADFAVQLGARITATDRSPFDDPFWWGPGFYRPHAHMRGGLVYWGPGWGYGWRIERPIYQREAAVLIRDRRSGETVYEARATSDGFAPMTGTALPAMFAAAMKDFPLGGVNPRRVTVPIGS